MSKGIKISDLYTRQLDGKTFVVLSSQKTYCEIYNKENPFDCFVVSKVNLSREYKPQQ